MACILTCSAWRFSPDAWKEAMVSLHYKVIDGIPMLVSNNSHSLAHLSVSTFPATILVFLTRWNLPNWKHPQSCSFLPFPWPPSKLYFVPVCISVIQSRDSTEIHDKCWLILFIIPNYFLLPLPWYSFYILVSMKTLLYVFLKIYKMED